MITKLITWILVTFFKHTECSECHRAFKDDITDRGLAGFCCYDCEEASYWFALQAEYEARLEAELEWKKERALFSEIQMSDEEIEARLNQAWSDVDLPEVDEITLREQQFSDLEQRTRCDCLDERVFDRCCELSSPYEDDEDDSVEGYSPDPAIYGNAVDQHTWAKVRSA